MTIKALLTSLIITASLYAGERISLFNGVDLTGWHDQADCEWSVVDSAIMGVNPNGTWCHLVTDSSYTDYHITLKYKIVKGNTGLYVRAGREDSGCCGIEGMQVDFGPSQDGSVMAVVDGEWFWYEQITRAVDEGLVDYAEWNELGVDVQGTGLSTWVNGHSIYSTENAEDMFPTGTIALQLHSGGAGDTILFKELELYLPKRIPGCMDTTMLEYDSTVNFHVVDSCKTLGISGITDLNIKPGQDLVVNTADAQRITLRAGIHRAELYNTRGQMVWIYVRGNSSVRESVRIPPQVEKGVLAVKMSLQ